MEIQVTKKRSWFLTLLIGISAVISIAATTTFVIMIYIQKGYFLSSVLGQCVKGFSPLPVILVFLDEFPVETFNKRLTPTLNKMKEGGSYANYMASSFPLNSAANYYTIVTGRYPDFHGVIDNENSQLRGNAMWDTVRKSSLYSATFSSPGPKIPDDPQTTHQRNTTNLIEQVLTRLSSNEILQRPSWISLYIRPEVPDNEDSPDQNQSTPDKIIEDLLKQLKEQDLHTCVNILIVTNPKMTFRQVTKIEEVIPEGLRDKISFNWDAATLTLSGNHQDTNELDASLTCDEKEFQIFRKRELPKRLHYSHGNEDYVFILKEMDTGSSNYEEYKTSTQGLFLAYGPAFKENFEIEPFQNIELYNFMCQLLNIHSTPNNGTWGLLESMFKARHRTPSVKGTPPTIQVNEEKTWDKTSHNLDCEMNDAAKSLLKNANKNKSAIEKRLAPWGVPRVQEGREGTNYALLYHQDHITGYSPEFKLPLWTSFIVKKTPSAQEDGNSEWIGDPRLDANESPSCEPVTITGKNHTWILSTLFRREFSADDSEALLSSLVSNRAYISTQLKLHWDELTLALIPAWFTIAESPLNVILGPVFDHDSDGVVDFPKLPVDSKGANPTDYFAIVTKCAIRARDLEHCPDDEVESMAFIYPQILTLHLCSIDAEEFALLFRAKVRDVERLTGLLFFPNVAPKARLKLISREYSRLWSFKYQREESVSG